MTKTRDYSQLTKKDFTCPITFWVYLAPVETNCGHIFESAAISKHQKTHSNCPLCRAEIQTLSPPAKEFIARFQQLLNEFPALKKKRYFDIEFFNSILQQSTSHPTYLDNAIELLLTTNDKRQLLNDTAICNDQPGLSPAFYLAATTEGRHVLRQHAELRTLITAKTLNTLITAGKHKGQSAAYHLFQHQDGLALLNEDMELRNKALQTEKNQIEQMIEYLIQGRMLYINDSLLKTPNALINEITAALSCFLYDNLSEPAILEAILKKLMQVECFGKRREEKFFIPSNPFKDAAKQAMNDLYQIQAKLFPVNANEQATLSRQIA